ncbi:MAG: diaminopimelate decarboxylase [Acidobacteriota bacterium]
MKPTRCFEYVGDKLYCEGVSLSSAADRFGTPCYIYSMEAICRNLKILKDSFPAEYAYICFAVKANSNLSILELLASQGIGFDIVSGGELYRLRRLGVSGSRIIFSGVGKRLDEIDWAIRTGVFSLGVESLEELEMIAGRAEALLTAVMVSLRLNLDVETETHPGISTGRKEHKFGLDTVFLPEASMFIKNHPLLRLKGIGSHIGSQIMDSAPYITAFERLLSCASDLKSSGFNIEFLDVGGGFGIPYDDDTGPFRLAEFAEYISKNRGPYRIVLEPGRFIVGSAGVLVSRVTLTKTTGGRKFLVLDAGMNDLMRPALYQARHQILPEGNTSRNTVTVDIVGPICETTDRFAENLSIPALKNGDLVAIMEAGAYGSVLSSNYNSRGRPAEIMVCGEEMRLIRKRESNEDLISDEII